MTEAEASLGTRFARALSAKDSTRLTELMHPEIDFRGMTPNPHWEAGSPDAVLEILFDHWFEDKDEIRELEHLEEGEEFADRQRVGYRFGIDNPEGRHVVEQQVYLTPRDGRIGWMRVLCSGFRPVP